MLRAEHEDGKLRGCNCDGEGGDGKALFTRIHGELRACAAERMQVMTRFSPLVARVTAKWSGHSEMKDLLESETRDALVASNVVQALLGAGVEEGFGRDDLR